MCMEPMCPVITAGRGSVGSLGSAVIAFYIFAITDVLFMISSDRFHHWFLIPISICGVLIGTDAIDWIRGRLDLYDPVGILGLAGVHIFYLSSLLHVQWDTWVIDSAPPPEWRDWLGYMGYLNAAGLVLYRVSRQIFKHKANYRPALWKIEKGKLRIVLPLCVLISAVAQTLVYAKFGGMVGYMDSVIRDPSNWAGMGWIFMISESAPILISFFVIVHLQRRGLNWSVAILAILVLFCIQMYFGGLRGSRSQTIELFFWVIGAVHFLVRPVPRRFVYAGLGVLIIFLYLYAFYKALGKDATQAITASAEDREHIAQTKHKTFRGLVLADLARADVQAYILFRLVTDGKDFFDYAKGRTYLAAISLWVPRWILPNRPLGKVKEGTEVQMGSGFDMNQNSSHVYGMAGEAMLNFGPLAAPLSFIAFGLLIGWFRRAIYSLPQGDARLLLVPFGVWMCLGFLLADSDNNAFGLMKDGLLPFLVVALSTVRIPFESCSAVRVTCTLRPQYTGTPAAFRS